MGRRIGVYVIASLGLVLGAAEGTARGGEFYYVLIFGSESHPKQLRYTHTWATFVRAVGEGPDPSNYALEVHTISWLPQRWRVKVWRPWPEPGVNLDLYQTLDAVLRQASGSRCGAVRHPQGGLRPVAVGPRRSSTAAGPRSGRSARAGPAHQRLHSRRRRRRPGVRPRALSPDPHRQAGLRGHRTPDHNSPPPRPGCGTTIPGSSHGSASIATDRGRRRRSRSPGATACCASARSKAPLPSGLDRAAVRWTATWFPVPVAWMRKTTASGRRLRRRPERRAEACGRDDEEDGADHGKHQELHPRELGDGDDGEHRRAEDGRDRESMRGISAALSMDTTRLSWPAGSSDGASCEVRPTQT